MNDDFKRRILQDAVRPLNEWCLIPVTERLPPSPGTRLWWNTGVIKHYLVPIGRAATVLDFYEGNAFDLGDQRDAEKVWPT